MNKYVKDGKVAVLVSPGFGAGWSTWNTEDLALDSRVVEYFFMRHHDQELLDKIAKLDTLENKEAKEYFESLGYDNVYFGGFNQIEIHWVKQGTIFRISEYDGNEHIVLQKDEKWMVA